MKKILLLCLLSSNAYAISIDDIQLPPTINKSQWLKDNAALPFNPSQEYDLIDAPFTPLPIKYIHCQYGVDILGGCKIQIIKYKPLNKH